MVLLVQIVFAQEKTVTGTVTDGSGITLPGVSILIKGTKTSTQTDFDGKYSIEAAEDQILIFSYIGMKTQEILAADMTINVKMQENAQEL